MLPNLKPQLSKHLRLRSPRHYEEPDLFAQLLRAQDEERRRIARELHDGTGQALALLLVRLRGLCDQSDSVLPQFAKSVSDCRQLAKQISDEIRTISYLLHPPLLDELGLRSAIEWYVEGFRERTHIGIGLHLPQRVDRLPANVQTALFRIVQESLTNVYRHSGSPTATIGLRVSASYVVLEIKDAGNGIARDKILSFTRGKSTGVGLQGMRERVKSLGGEMEIASAHKGTQIRVVIPCGLNERRN